MQVETVLAIRIPGEFSSSPVLIALVERMHDRVLSSDIRCLLTSRRGLEADQKVIAAHGCYAMTATTALTAQNTQGVFDVHHTPPAFVARQIELCWDDIGVDVVKIG